MVKVASLEADIKINSGDASKKLDEINKKLNNLDTASEKTARNTSLNWVTAVGSLMNGAGKLIGFLGDQANKVKETTFNFDKLSRMTGHSAHEFQKWRAIIEQSGGSFNDFMSTLESIRNIQGGFYDTGVLPMAFKKLGIDPRGADIEVLERAVEKLKQIDDISRRNYYAKQLGISPDILGILTSGGGIGFFDKSMELTEKQLAAARELRRESIILAQRWEQVLNRLGAVVIPILNKLGNMGLGIANNILDTLEGGSGGSDDWNNIIKLMRGAGLSENAIAGILGNASVESSLDPRAKNGSHTGLFQWDKTRFANLEKELGEENKDLLYSASAQVAFVIGEMHKRGVFDEINKASSPEEAARLFEKYIEVSGWKKVNGKWMPTEPQMLKQRMSRARAAYDILSSGGEITAEGLEARGRVSSFSPSGAYAGASNFTEYGGSSTVVYNSYDVDISANKVDANSIKELHSENGGTKTSGAVYSSK